MDKTTFTRKELYDYLWSHPVNSLFKIYDINYGELKKICQDMKIPIPENGHWQKVKFGKTIKSVPLPVDYSGTNEISFKLAKVKDHIISNFIRPLSIEKKEIVIENKPAIEVDSRLTKPDKLIVAAKEHLTRKNAYKENGLVRSLTEILNIKVAPINISRALLFMDALIKVLKERGHLVNIIYRETYIFIEDEKIKISLREKLKRNKIPSNHSWQQYEYVPTGIFIFSFGPAYNSSEWKDGKSLLEKQLFKIVTAIELFAKQKKEESKEREIRQAEIQENERIEKNIEQQKQNETLAFQELLKDSSSWHQVKVLRNYIDAVEEKAIIKNKFPEELKTWIMWAREKADEYDPIYKVFRESNFKLDHKSF